MINTIDFEHLKHQPQLVGRLISTRSTPKSTDQLMEIIKYLRNEKSILTGKVEVSRAESCPGAVASATVAATFKQTSVAAHVTEPQVTPVGASHAFVKVYPIWAGSSNVLQSAASLHSLLG